MSLNLIDNIVNSNLKGERKRANKILLYNAIKDFVKRHEETKEIKTLLDKLEKQLINYTNQLNL